MSAPKSCCCTISCELHLAAPELAEVVRATQWWRGFPGESSIALFERIGAAFRRETGFLRPGKDYSARENVDEQARSDAWGEWCERKNDELDAKIAAALTKAGAK